MDFEDYAESVDEDGVFEDSHHRCDENRLNAARDRTTHGSTIDRFARRVTEDPAQVASVGRGTGPAQRAAVRAPPPLLLLAFTIAAHADATPPDEIRGGEHPGFRQWVERWATARHGGAVDWWSADLDGDHEADDIAVVCLPRAVGGWDDPGHAILIEDAHGKRLAYGDPLRDSDDGPCELPSGPPAFRRTAERTLVDEDGDNRVHSSTTFALRDGALAKLSESNNVFRNCRYDDGTGTDWTRLERYASSITERAADGWQLQTDGQADCVTVSEERRDEALLLVTSRPMALPTYQVPVRGKSLWRGPADASFSVVVMQPDTRTLAITLGRTDDKQVDAAAKSEEALAAADHFEVWMGIRSLRVARAIDGAWFVEPGVMVGPMELPRVSLRGAERSVTLVVPLEWADWRPSGEMGFFHRPEGPGPALDNVEEVDGALAVAYFDVDRAGQSARVVLSTAPIPRVGAPHGVLVKLPGGARFPPAEHVLPVE